MGSLVDMAQGVTTKVVDTRNKLTAHLRAMARVLDTDNKVIVKLRKFSSIAFRTVLNENGLLIVQCQWFTMCTNM